MKTKNKTKIFIFQIKITRKYFCLRKEKISLVQRGELVLFFLFQIENEKRQGEKEGETEQVHACMYVCMFVSEVEFDMYAPGIEKAGEEREVFLEVSNECMEYNESKQVIVVEDTNTKVGIREVDNITGSL